MEEVIFNGEVGNIESNINKVDSFDGEISDAAAQMKYPSIKCLRDMVHILKAGTKDMTLANGFTFTWHYRVWSDGTAECWGNTECTMAINAPWNTGNPIYRSVDASEETVGVTGSVRATPSINYPFTFSEIPSEQISFNRKTDSGGNIWLSSYRARTAGHTGRYQAIRPSGGTDLTTYLFSYYVIGTVDLSDLDL